MSVMSIGFLGANLYQGQSHRGVAKAPHFLRQNKILESLSVGGAEVIDFGDALVDAENSEIYRSLALRTCELLKKSDFPFLVGGDHSISAATISALLVFHPGLKILWVDAHGDMNTPQSSPSQNLHGMPVAALLGLLDAKDVFGFHVGRIERDQICYLGVRDLDPAEEHLFESLGIAHYDAKLIRRVGISRVLKRIKKEFLGNSPLHISFDLDVMEPKDYSATGVPVKGGLNGQDLAHLCHFIQTYENLVALEAVELNPDLGDSKGLQNSLSVFHALARAVSYSRDLRSRRPTDSRSSLPNHSIISLK